MPTYQLSSTGASLPVQINARAIRGLPPAILVGLSDGAVLTYNVEVTADDPDANGNFPFNGNWSGTDGMVGLTASANFTLGACVTAIRARVTAYTSGTLTFSMPV